MPENTPYADLKEAIKTLEKKQADSKLLLQDQFKVTYESLNPLSIIKSAFSSVTDSPEIRNSLLSMIIPLVTVFLNKRAFSAPRRPPIVSQAGILILDSLNRYISQNPEVVNTLSHFILGLFRKKKTAVDPME